MQVTINGKPKEVKEKTTLQDLLTGLAIQRRGTAVEINKEIVPRASHAQKIIEEGDVIEIITMVGGG
ncbi:MAG: sulfur carrier protein ThiS [Thermodesulfobacteriota bacterium]